jgi:hypothetical protein
VTLAPTRFAPALFLARSSLASYTWTECARMLEPVGVDLWSHELALKYGMRWVHLSCRRAMGWSKRVLCNILTPASRILLQTASSFAAQRLEHLAGLT